MIPSSRFLSAAAAAALLFVAASPAVAGIVSSGSGITVQTAPTGTLTHNTLESNTRVRVWFEGNVSLASSITANHVGAGTVNSNGSASSGAIAAGTLLESYFFHFDKVGSSGTQVAIVSTAGSLSVSFSGTIAGVFFLNLGLSNSDAVFAPAGLTYAGGARRLEFGGDNDSFTVSSDLHTLTINRLRVNNGELDQLRVVVIPASVTTPEPASCALFACALAALAPLVARRRARRRAGAPLTPAAS